MIKIKLEYSLPFVFLIFLTFDVVDNKLVVHMTDVLVNTSEVFKGNVSANIRTVDKKNLLTVNFTTPEDINDKLMISFSMFRNTHYNTYTPFVKNLTANLCNIFRKPNFPPMLMPIYTEYLRHTDLPPRCPVLQNTYHITDYYVRGELFPAFMPRISFKVNFHFYQIRSKMNYQLAFVSVLGKIKNIKA